MARSAFVVALWAGLLVATVPSFAQASRAPRSVREMPGYYPPADPESASVRIGRRRNAPLVRMPFHGGARTLDELGRAICWAAHHSSEDTLWKLTVDEQEFRTIMWREFPNSRPITGITADEAWSVGWVRYASGIRRFMDEQGGRQLQYVRFERADTVAAYKNFRLHNGLTLVVKGPEGREERLDFIRAAAERKGRFKIQGVRD
jgi:hypothetical protein